MAFIGGAAGLLTGAVTGVAGSLIAPWANWGVEKKRLKQHRREEHIKEWREGVDNMRWAESESFLGRGPAPQVVFGGGDPDRPLESKGWFAAFRAELTPEVIAEIDRLCQVPPVSRLGKLPQLIDREISRIEREKWKLV